MPTQAPLVLEPPPIPGRPGQLSPDGYYYWDGERWVVTPRNGHASRNLSLGLLGLIVVLIVIGILVNRLARP